MLVLSGSGGVSPLRPTQTRYTTANTVETAARTQSAAGSYDQLALSPEPVGERRFQLEWISRLSHEVRTVSTPASEVEALRQQVAEGSYQPDPAAIAARMLLLEGDRFQ